MAATAAAKNRKIWYVYELIDPRNSTVFYVGKGTGDRINAHGKPKDNSNTTKQARIKAIGSENVVRVKVAEFWDENAAYEHEKDRIGWYIGLTNIRDCKHQAISHSFYGCVIRAMFGDNAAKSILKRVFPIKTLPNKEYKQLYIAAIGVA